MSAIILTFPLIVTSLLIITRSAVTLRSPAKSVSTRSSPLAAKTSRPIFASCARVITLPARYKSRSVWPVNLTMLPKTKPYSEMPSRRRLFPATNSSPFLTSVVVVRLLPASNKLFPAQSPTDCSASSSSVTKVGATSLEVWYHQGRVLG